MISDTVERLVLRGEMVRGDTCIPVTITVSHPTLGPGTVECQVVPEGVMSATEFDNTATPGEVVQLCGRTEDGEEVLIPEFWVTRRTGYRGGSSTTAGCWEGSARFLVRGDVGEFDGSGGSVYCALTLPPTPLTESGLYVRHWDGTIELRGGERSGVQWTSELGKAELIDSYEYVNDKAAIDDALIRIRRSQITVRGRPEGTVSLEAVLQQLREELKGALSLLSFISRKRLDWYSATARFHPEDPGGREARRVRARRSVWLGYPERSSNETSRWDMLVHRETLRDGLFQELPQAYEASPYRSTISLAMISILASHERSYFEQRLMNVYTALESLVNGLGSEKELTDLLGRSRFERLASSLRSVIRCMVQDQAAAEGVIKKLPELRRRAFVDRLVLLLGECGPDLTRIWPTDVDVESVLCSAMARRNLLIHQGRMGNVQEYTADFDRLQELVELWILNLLNCPETAVNESAFSSRHTW